MDAYLPLVLKLLMIGAIIGLAMRELIVLDRTKKKRPYRKGQ